MSRSHSIGDLPYRRTISWNSLTDCDTCKVTGTPGRAPAARTRRNRSSLQVSTCEGESRPLTSPPWLPSLRSIQATARSKAAMPAASSHWYYTDLPSSVCQRAERNIGPM